MAIAYGFAQCGLFCTRSGGMSAYTEEAHGKSGFFLCSFLYFLSLIIANVAIAISAVGYLSSFIPWLGSGPGPLFVGSLALIWLTTVANFGGPRITGAHRSGHGMGRDHSSGGALRDRLVLFQARGVHGRLEPTPTAPVGRRQCEYSSDLVGVSWHGVGRPGLRRGGAPQPHRAPGLPARHAWGGGGVRAVDCGDVQGIVPNAELAASSAPFALVYAQMFSPWVGKLIMALGGGGLYRLVAGPGNSPMAQTAKMSADQRLFPRFFSRISAANAPVLGLLACATLQSLIALSTISPSASAQFSKLVNLAVVTNLLPYVTALTGLLVMMYKAHASATVQARNTLVVLVAVGYSLYAIYACGEEAVFGAMLVLAFGYLLYGFLAKRFIGEPADSPGR